MRTLNVAIAGSGYSSRLFHVPFLKDDARFAIKKFYERTTERGLQWVPTAEVVRDYSQLLTDDIDAVIITTPNQTHYEMVKKAIVAGKHVLVEKPLVATAKEAFELGELAKQHNVVLYVYQNRRWDSEIATAKQIIEQGLLGELVDCEIRIDRYAKAKNSKLWKELGDKGTGLVYDLAVHLIDQSVYLFGQPKAVFADIRYQHEGALVDDNFDIHLYYENGLKASLLASKYVRETGNHFSLHGRLGSYVKKDVDIQESLLNKGVLTKGDWFMESISGWGILHTELNGELIRQSYPNVSCSYQNLYDNFYESIVNQQPQIVTIEQVITVLNIIEKAFESSVQGKKIAL
ncbi:Gfo/Idh/MocA family oxidoreductase [Pasteurella bettyae]|uniref:Oxidoreductase, NAD-binding domain protein n=1 Tax=Pasteurella bettyae CCUG 2042 TaxID=1095749 RepID=I3DBI7_9PAST|nr:Gfo/Idh/MocA family oxidoreductase [Pasteurella bettyae]EIJ69080.1 oxidoreductase, NAD-binding domain protein [Pasteurella bettyae CCUG 2042]SUB22936.1 oxidoreductase YdgJ [Pasteurella bettyae]